MNDAVNMGVDESSSTSSTNQLQQQVDISCLVDNYLKINNYIKPLIHINNITSYILRWEKPCHSVCVWILTLAICLLVTSDVIFWSSLAIIWLAAGVKIALTMLKKSENVTVRPDILNETMNTRCHQDVINDFHMLLQQLEYFFKFLDVYLHKLSEILMWSDMKNSLRWFGTLSVLALLSYFIPYRIIVSAGVCYVFTRPHQFQTVLWKAVNRLHCDLNRCMEKVYPILLRIKQKSKKQDVVVEGKVSSEPSEETVTSDQNSPEVQNSEENMSELSSSEGRVPSSPTKTGVVNRIKSLRRKRDRAPPGSCCGCNIAFSSLLRKRGRVHCRHCGNQFCDKCCIQQVPRSLFGATAPAAQHETVPVCSLCYKTLFDSLIRKVENQDSHPHQ